MYGRETLGPAGASKRMRNGAVNEARMDENEAALVRRAAAGDDSAFAALVEAH